MDTEQLLEATLVELKAQKEKLDMAIDSIERLLNRTESQERRPMIRKRSSNGKPLRVGELAAQLLRIKGRPMRTPELLSELRERGTKIKNTNSLYGCLVNEAKRGLLVNRGGGLWALPAEGGTTQNSAPMVAHGSAD